MLAHCPRAAMPAVPVLGALLALRWLELTLDERRGRWSRRWPSWGLHAKAALPRVPLQEEVGSSVLEKGHAGVRSWGVAAADGGTRHLAGGIVGWGVLKSVLWESPDFHQEGQGGATISEHWAPALVLVTGSFF